MIVLILDYFLKSHIVRHEIFNYVLWPSSTVNRSRTDGSSNVEHDNCLGGVSIPSYRATYSIHVKTFLTLAPPSESFHDVTS